MSSLAERGYYLYPPHLVLEVFQQERADDAERFVEAPLQIFREVFATDGVLFTVIHRWDKSIISNTIDVEIEYILRSARSNETLFRRKIAMQVDTSIGLNSGLLDLLVNAIATAASSKIIGARQANYLAFEDLPYGPLAPEHGKDGKTRVDKPNLRSYR